MGPLKPKPVKPQPKFPSMMEFNGPRRTGKSALDQGLDFVFSPFTALSGIVNQNAPIKKGGKYQVPQDMMKGRTKRQNSVTANPRSRKGAIAGAAVGKMRKPIRGMNSR